MNLILLQNINSSRIINFFLFCEKQKRRIWTQNNISINPEKCHADWQPVSPTGRRMFERNYFWTHLIFRIEQSQVDLKGDESARDGNQRKLRILSHVLGV